MAGILRVLCKGVKIHQNSWCEFTPRFLSHGSTHTSASLDNNQNIPKKQTGCCMSGCAFLAILAEVNCKLL